MTDVEKDMIENSHSPDLIGSIAAMKRASELAKKVAIDTNTGIVMCPNGENIFIKAEDLIAANTK
jgi:hypothetical protein